MYSCDLAEEDITFCDSGRLSHHSKGQAPKTEAKFSCDVLLHYRRSRSI